MNVKQPADKKQKKKTKERKEKWDYSLSNALFDDFNVLRFDYIIVRN